MSDELADIQQKLGYIQGKVEAIHEDNNQAHNDIKLAIEKTALKVEMVCGDMIRFQSQLDLHGNRITKVEGRTTVIESKQQYISGMAKFITDHPKLVIGLFIVIVAMVTGLSIEEVRAVFGG